ncbi:MAG TPA: FecR family protein [Steroidobacteraceae bacterium]|nr:FecR family protein [Steroidobacteraceae bacterium]
MTRLGGSMDSGGPDDIERLIVAAGRRPEPSAEVRESVRATVEQAWLAGTARRERRQRVRWLAASAVLFAAIGLGWFGMRRESTESPVPVGTLVAARGAVQLNSPGKSSPIVAGIRLAAGTVVRTGPNGYLLLTVSSVDVRVGPRSTLDLDRRGHIELTRGRIYADSGASDSAYRPLVVDTPFGRVNHLGTQFQVAVHSSSMAVSVRSGRVLVTEPGGQTQTLARGQGIAVYRDGTIDRLAIAPYGANWRWVNTLMPDFPIDGRPLSEFLAWYTRETGRTLVLLDPASQAAMARVRLSGSIEGLTPSQALTAVMATTRFEYDMSVPGELRIGIRGATEQGS